MATVGEVLRSSAGSPELHVLAVDDSHVDRKVIEKLLKISCCKVTAVDSGTRALQYLGLDGEKSSVEFDALKVNMIITDYSMPGMTGYELLKKIKESSAFREIPVVIMSSENILTRIDRCLEEGAEEYLVKPVKLADVKRLKDCLIKGEGKENGKIGLNKKRKLPEDNDTDSSSSSSPSTPQSPSTPLSFCPSTSTGCDSASSSQLESSPTSSQLESSSPTLLPEEHFMKRPNLHSMDCCGGEDLSVVVNSQ